MAPDKLLPRQHRVSDLKYRDLLFSNHFTLCPAIILREPEAILQDGRVFHIAGRFISLGRPPQPVCMCIFNRVPRNTGKKTRRYPLMPNENKSSLNGWPSESAIARYLEIRPRATVTPSGKLTYPNSHISNSIRDSGIFRRIVKSY